MVGMARAQMYVNPHSKVIAIFNTKSLPQSLRKGW
jgi:hypothetical protein